MKKMFFLAATAALVLSSCSSDELVQEQPVAEDGAITFGAYQGRETRNPSPIATEIVDLANNGGFGVFAYEQGSTDFVSYLASNTYPNFMYNQQVWEHTLASTAGHKAVVDTKVNDDATSATWEYSPLKYWPNNGGKVTFQTYAPYNANVETSFGPTYNGVGVRYNTAENYDLLWGASSASADAKCFVNKQKPDVEAKTLFQFKHALSKLDVTVSYFSDKAHDGTSSTGIADGLAALEQYTTIVVRSIKLVGDQPSQGVVSLYDGKWTIEKMDANIGFNTADLTMGSADGTAWTAASYDADDAYENGTLNSTVKAIQNATSLLLIPTAAKRHIEVTYDVITKDPNDPRNNSTVTNTISSKESASNLYPTAHGFDGIILAAGAWTTLNIHLGLTSVKFDAAVTAWPNTTSNADVDLPNNKPASSSNRR